MNTVNVTENINIKITYFVLLITFPSLHKQLINLQVFIFVSFMSYQKGSVVQMLHYVLKTICV